MTCKDCIHYDVCGARYESQYPYAGIGFGDDNEGVETFCEWGDGFKDKSRFIELPCKVGDTLYLISNDEICLLRVKEVIVSKYKHRIRALCPKYAGCLVTDPCIAPLEICEAYYSEYEIGKSIFLTREEAEKALKEKK